MHHPWITRGALTLFAFAVLLSPASGTRAQSRGALPSTASAACIAAAENDVWKIDVNASYSRSDSLPGQFTESQVNQSGGFTVTFEQSYIDDAKAVWTAQSATGSGSIHGRDVKHDPNSGDQITTVDGDGGPVATHGSLVLNRTTCTYNLWVIVSIEVTSKYPEDQGGTVQTHYDDAFNLTLKNRPVPTSNTRAVAAPVLGGNASMPINVTYNQDPEEFQAAAAADTVRDMARFKNQTTAGSAAVSWAAKPNEAMPYISEMHFEHQEMPSQRWVRTGQNGTVDGNWVEVVAQVTNPRNVGLVTQARFYLADTGEMLPNCNIAVGVPENATADVKCFWDTEGYAWDDNFTPGKPTAKPQRRVLVKLGTDDFLYDQHQETLIVRPKPVIMVHGLNSNDAGWSKYPQFLHAANDYWTGYAVPGMQTGDDIVSQKQSTTLLNNARTMHQYIQSVRKLENAWHVDIVAHSMGGLISRQYIHTYMPADTPDGRPVARHLVMLGTPNLGSDCATIQFTLGMVYDLPNIIAPAELIPAVVAGFNKRVTNQKGTEFSVLAGNKSTFLCNPNEDALNDMVVTVPSAHYIYSDIGLTPRNHIQMTGSQDDFAEWVLPHLAITREPGKAVLRSSARVSSASTEATPMQFAQTSKQDVVAGGSTTIALHLPQGQRVGVHVMAAPHVSIALHDPNGTQVATSVAGSDEAQFGTRTFVVTNPAAGEWTLRVSSQEAQTTSVFVVTSVANSQIVAEATVGDRNAKGERVLSAALRRDGAATPGAIAQAKLLHEDGTTTMVKLFDDGQHGDNAANDGMFGAVLSGADAQLINALFQLDSGGEVRNVEAAPGDSTSSSSSSRVFVPLVRR